MSEYNKQRYYWIKLTDSFMSSEVVDFLLSQKGGANYVVIYEMLCLKTVNNGGCLFTSIGELIIPYDEVKIQRDLKWFSIDTIRVALSLYQRLGLIYEQSDGIFRITGFDDMVGSQTISAAKKGLQRKNSADIKVDKAVESKVENRVDKAVDTRVDICPPEIKRLEIRDKIVSHETHACTHEARVGESDSKGLKGFLAAHPRIKNDVAQSEKELTGIDWSAVETAFRESEWLAGVDSLYWIVRNVDKILAGKYKTYKPSVNGKTNHFSCEREYAQEDLNKLFTDVEDIDF